MALTSLTTKTMCPKAVHFTTTMMTLMWEAQMSTQSQPNSHTNSFVIYTEAAWSNWKSVYGMQPPQTHLHHSAPFSCYQRSWRGGIAGWTFKALKVLKIGGQISICASSGGDFRHVWTRGSWFSPWSELGLHMACVSLEPNLLPVPDPENICGIAESQCSSSVGDSWKGLWFLDNNNIIPTPV